eukprot:scaffold10436_cov85-Skeletonema_dohrnii-CCMP3373.AAC.2
MNLSDEDVRVILAKQPAVLHYSAERNLGSTIIFLVRALDLSKSELRSLVLDSPSILGYSLSNLSRKLSFFVNTLGYVDEDNYFEGMDRVRKLLVGTPKLLLSAVDTGLEPRFQFLHNEIEFSLPELQRLYEKNPKLLMYSLDENMREKIVFFFILRLRIGPENVRKLLLSFPQVMDYNLENHLKPIADYYISDVRFSATEFGSIVTRFPRLFSYSLFKIKHVTGFLRFELGLDATQVKRVIFQAPQIVGLNTEGNLQMKLDLLQTRLSLTRQELGLVLSKMPTLMNLGIDNNLLPKLEYLEKVANDTNHSGDVVKRMVLKQPTLLGYSLENRIRPRMEKILSAGLSADKVTVGISMAENNFQDWLASSQLRKQLKVDVQKNLHNASRSKMTYLEELLDMNETEVRTLLSTMPGLKYVRSNKMFERKVTYFNAELQNVTIATKAILMGRPSLLQCSIKQGWEPRMQQIRAVGTDDLQKVTALFLMSDDEFQAWTLKKKYTETIDFLRTSSSSSSVQFNEDDLNSFLLQVAGLCISDANLKEVVKILLSLSGGSLDGINTIALDNPHLLLSTQALRERMMLRETLCHKVKQYWDFDEMATLIMSEEDFEYQLSLCDAKMLLHKKLHFTRKELDFVVSQQVKKEFPIDLAAKLDYLMSQDVCADIEIAILTKPKLLSHTIEKLRSMPRALLRRSKLKAKLIYEEDTKEMLLAFGFSSIDVTNIVSRSRILGMRHPQMILKPKLELLLSTWKKEEIITHARAKPLLFDKSLAELELLVKKGVPSSKPKNKASLGASNTNQMEEIKAELNLTEAEFELMFPKRQLCRDIIPTWQYLSTQVDSLEGLKEALLSEPRILSLSLSKRIKPRMELLLERGCDPADIVSIALLSQKKAEEFCLQCYFCREFELSQKQADRLLRKVLVDKQSRSCLQQKVEYLLPNAFGDSRKKMKDAMLKTPSMLKQSLDQTIKPRVEVLQLLRSAGFDVTEHGPLLSMRNSEFTNELLLHKSWSPEQTVDKPFTAPTNVHAAAVKELMPSSLAISFSDDDNRDVATVVQWR